MTWTLIVYNPIKLDETLARFDNIKSIDELGNLWHQEYKNTFITATKLRNLFHTCKNKEENYIKILKD